MSVFLSYSRIDSEFAGQLLADLEARGLEVWMDRNAIEAGTLWRTSIVTGIQNCQVFLLIVSEASQQSRNVAKELALAESNKKMILPLKIDNAPIHQDFSYSLAGIQFLDLPQNGYSDCLLKIVQAVQLLKGECIITHPTQAGLRLEDVDSSQENSRKSMPLNDLSTNPSELLLEPSHSSLQLGNERLVGMETVVAEELGPIVQLLWSEEFATDLLKQPDAIVAKLRGMGVPEATALRLRERLQPFLLQR